MAKLVATAGNVQIEDGVYVAQLLSIDVQQPAPTSPYQNPWLKWRFAVENGSAEGMELTAASSTSFGPKAKARKWIETLLGKKLNPGDEVDPDTLCPRDCQILIKNDPETGFARIQDVMAPRRSAMPRKVVTDGVEL